MKALLISLQHLMMVYICFSDLLNSGIKAVIPKLTVGQLLEKNMVINICCIFILLMSSFWHDVKSFVPWKSYITINQFKGPQ